MKRPSVAECLAEVDRLRRENERLKRLVQSQRPELPALRSIAVFVRDMLFNLQMQLGDLQKDLAALLPPNADDLPSLGEMLGILSDGRERVYAALESPPSVAAVDPIGELAKQDPTTREKGSSDV